MGASEAAMDGAQERSSPPALTVSQVHAGIDAAIAAVGLGQLWVLGAISSLRRKRGGFVSLELVEYQRDATTVRAVLPVGIFREPAAQIDHVLAEAGVELADGLEVAMFGRLETNGAYGPLRFVGLGVDPRIAVGAAVLARDELLRELEANGQLVAQRALVMPGGRCSSAASSGAATT